MAEAASVRSLCFQKDDDPGKHRRHLDHGEFQLPVSFLFP